MTRVNASMGAVVLCLVAAAGTAAAQSLFRIQLSEVGNAGNMESIAGSSIIDLVQTAINTDTAQVARFGSLDTAISVDYAGIPNAITLSKNAANTQATLQFNIGDRQTLRTFTGTSQDDLENQIEEYLKKDGGEDVAAFLRAVNAVSLVAVSDGNPNATTARMAQFAFNRYGMHDDFTGAVRREEDGDRVSGGLQWRLDASGGIFDAGDFDGETAQLHGTFDYWFSERIGMSWGVLLAYTSVEEADVYHTAGQFGVPFRIMNPTESRPLLWQLTPSVAAGGSGSEDFAAGGLIYGLGGTSVLTYELMKKLTLTMTNQFSAYEGATLEYDEYELDPGVSQQILKNGLKGTLRIGESWYAWAGCSMTNFLEDAAVDDYYSPTLGIGWYRQGGTGLQVGYFGDFGHEYESHQARVALNIGF